MLWMFKGAMMHLVSEARDLPPRVGAVSTHPGGTWNVEMLTVSLLVRAAFVALSAHSFRGLLAWAFTHVADRVPWWFLIR